MPPSSPSRNNPSRDAGKPVPQLKVSKPIPLRPHPAPVFPGSAAAGSGSSVEVAALQALQFDPDNTSARKALIRACLDARRFDEARDHCRCILELKPRDPETLQLLSRCQFNLEEFLEDAPADPSEAARTAASPRPQTNPAPRVEQPSAATFSLLSPEALLRQLVSRADPSPIGLESKQTAPASASDGFPLPPESLTMGYGAGDMNHYMECGRRSYRNLTAILSEAKVTLDLGDAMMDWGCAAGRVVRMFKDEAERGCKVWGCDVDVPAIRWAQNHLSPPFRFFNATSFPYLPFPNGAFKFIYGLSVFTHLNLMRDLWLLELSRALRPDGCMVMTVHDEHCWSVFQRDGMPSWVPSELRGHEELPAECVEIRGDRWDRCYTFFHSDYIRRVWGRFLDIAAIIPGADAYQAAVVMRKS